MQAPLVDRIIEYVQGLTWPNGDPVSLFPYQRKVFQGLYGRRNLPFAYITVPRGNGKSGFGSLVALCYLPASRSGDYRQPLLLGADEQPEPPNHGPLWTPQAEVVLVSASYAQSRIVYDDILAMKQADLVARPREWSVNQSPTQLRLQHRPSGASIRAISSDFRRMHGLRPNVVIPDESAQWPPGSIEQAWSALIGGMGKKPNSKFVAISTLPNDPTHPFVRALDNPTRDQITVDYRLTDMAADPFDEGLWRKLNPAWRYLPELRKQIRAEARIAQQDPVALEAFRSWRLNAGALQQNVHDLLPLADYVRLEGQEADRDGPMILGLDLATTGQSAAVALWPRSGRLEALIGVAADPDLSERGRRHGVADLYLRMQERGELIVCGQRTLDIQAFLSAVVDQFGIPRAMICDSFRASELFDAMERMRFPIHPQQVHQRRSMWREQSEDIRAMLRMAYEGDLKPVPNLALRDGFRWGQVEHDTSGNVRMRRRSDHGHRKPDDVAAACVLVCGLAYSEPSIRRPSQRVAATA